MNYIEAQNKVYHNKIEDLQRDILDLEVKLTMQKQEYERLLKKYDTAVGYHAVSSDT